MQATPGKSESPFRLGKRPDKSMLMPSGRSYGKLTSHEMNAVERMLDKIAEPDRLPLTVIGEMPSAPFRYRPSPYGFPGRLLWRARSGRMEKMTVPLDTMNDMRLRMPPGARGPRSPGMTRMDWLH